MNDTAPSGKRTVFVSYSHQNEQWKRPVVDSLRFYEPDFDLWIDTKLEAGHELTPEIKAAMNTADAAILIVSNDSLKPG